MIKNFYKSNFYNRFSVEKTFDLSEIKESLDKFSNEIIGNCLITKYGDKQICSAEISGVYYNFDFSNFSKSILSEIEKYFIPEKYTLDIKGGTQEIRLSGGEIFIDNERYEKMISINNSTDKSKALSMNIGLIRVDKDKKLKYIIILTNINNKHYKSTLPDKIKLFTDNLINFNMDIDFHIKTIEDLNNKKVSIKELSNSILHDKNGKFIKSNELKLRALGNKLIYNYDFKKYYNVLSNLTKNNIDKIDDIIIDCKILYNAYLEIFSNKDTSVISRESKRIIEIMESIQDVK
jgi:hypothetical protein